MKMEWGRVLRTLVQSASGAGIALITAITADWSKEAIIAAAVQFASTVAIAVLMNIKSQADDAEEKEEKQ